MAFITPAKDHPEVIVQTVAARDKSKAQAYAAKNGIPQVHDSYQGDIPLDWVFIPEY